MDHDLGELLPPFHAISQPFACCTVRVLHATPGRTMDKTNSKTAVPDFEVDGVACQPQPSSGAVKVGAGSIGMTWHWTLAKAVKLRKDDGEKHDPQSYKIAAARWLASEAGRQHALRAAIASDVPMAEADLPPNLPHREARALDVSNVLDSRTREAEERQPTSRPGDNRYEPEPLRSRATGSRRPDRVLEAERVEPQLASQLDALFSQLRDSIAHGDSAGSATDAALDGEMPPWSERQPWRCTARCSRCSQPLRQGRSTCTCGQRSRRPS